MKSAFARWRLGAQPAIPPALLKNLVPIVVLAIGITAMVTMYAWRDQANYKPVFGAREKVAVTDMMATLDAEHIPYRLHPDSGQVLVPDAMLGKVRMLLASKGVTAQLPAGLELMDKNDPLGVSQFVQDVRFRRGLEGELAQSIMTMDAIASARVHLSIAKSTSFVASDGDKSSASIVVALKPGRTLAPEQIAAVINMVAGSVASLAPTRVSLVDQGGNLLSAHVDLTDGFDASAAGNEGAKRFQDEIRRNVTGLLGPVIGEDNFKLSVTAAVNNDRVDETLEKYGEAPKVTSEAMREEQERNRTVAGIPGSLSNRPPAAAVPAPADAAGAAPADGAPKPSDDGTARKNATTRQYAYDRSITQIKRSRGRLEKLSVAVVLNSAAAPNPKTGWTPAELGNIEKMLNSGLGINAQRGDSLSLTALAFPAKPPVAQWWEERDTVVDFSSWLLYALGAILGYFLILRPLLRLLTTRLAPPALKQLDPALALGGSAAAGANGAAVAGAPALGVNGTPLALEGEAAGGSMPVVPLLENYDLPPPGSAVDVMVDHLKVLAEKEPERVAEVVKQWMQKNGRTQQQ
ncbi:MULTISPECIES: flagellar basal-body MS-ring/collar protein FliF [Janthinobacterium]|uniref:Flagellar M-ring protein n=1 Tax=Janthinobacterium kumbetense TaxID=2950280 RepID=A0ABT0WN02_9BURK|nr:MULTISPECIES: flagellar basal-body MS-ring/collar protein FliF [Janthinobacterium]AQR69113.1 flagellar M-ring protein FliF [Janthinobacterium sp. LM6]MCM2565357.1 flagellar M-ring protein FliF [Janthinobacterium kumbetense]MDN2676872.1 flagellar basal-body MS-ring/collar protein FliF [Janthinobacterium sp. SUN033]MDN2714657.1 flagellar basal-body MS-ring/collar protein FliF [Janthinobacterium sp. SUN120]MDO8064404.1 flagellar basal-body MS-ring/collar protein FliF [Janthinobacterium sp. SUN